MRRLSVSDPAYDPANFVAAFPKDEHVQAALKAALDLSQKIQPALAGKTPEEAQAVIHKAFKALRDEFDEKLDAFHKLERERRKDRFAQEKEKEIVAEYQPGIDKTASHDLKVGGQFARDEKIRLFKENIDSNEELKKAMLDLSNKQAVRSEAISYAINYTPPGGRHFEPEPPGGGGPSLTKPYQKTGELPPPSQSQQYFEALPWESPLEANERGTGAVEALNSRQQDQQPTAARER